MRQSEDQVEISDGQETALLLVKPPVSCLPLADRTMAITAGVRHEVALPALLTAIAMAEKRAYDTP